MNLDSVISTLGRIKRFGVERIQGRRVASTEPTTGQVLTWNAATSQWEPTAPGAPSAHVLATTAGLGASHTTSGLTAGQMLRATAATTAAFQAILDADLPASITRDAEHGGFVPLGHHSPLTIGADVEHSLAGQVLSGVDAAAAQKGHIQLAGELGGAAAAPTVAATHSGSAHHAKGFAAYVDAAGNGDYTTIQAAIDAGATSIFIAAGTYAAFTSTNVCRRIVGADKANVQIRGACTVSTVFCSVESVGFFSAAGVNAGVTQVKLNATFCSLINCLFQHQDAGAVRSVAQLGQPDCFILGCTFNDTVGLVGDTPACITGTQAALDGCIIQGCGFGANFRSHIDLSTSDAVLIINNAFRLGASALHAVRILNNCVAVGNQFENVARGVLVRGAGNVVGPNIFTVDSGRCIQVGEAALLGVTRNQVSNNIMRGVLAGDGILLIDADNTVIQGNIITGAPGYGINVSNAACDNTQLIGNNVLGNTTGGIQDLGTLTRFVSNIGG